MKLYQDAEKAPEIPKLFLKPEDAATALSMCRSMLERNLHPNGAKIPFFRLGKRLFFSVSELEEWGREQIVKQRRKAEQQQNIEMEGCK